MAFWTILSFGHLVTSAEMSGQFRPVKQVLKCLVSNVWWLPCEKSWIHELVDCLVVY